MSTKNDKVVRIAESALVDMIENIVVSAVAESKRTWIAEQNKKQEAILEEQIDRILAKKIRIAKK